MFLLLLTNQDYWYSLARIGDALFLCVGNYSIISFTHNGLVSKSIFIRMGRRYEYIRKNQFTLKFSSKHTQLRRHMIYWHLKCRFRTCIYYKRCLSIRRHGIDVTTLLSMTSCNLLLTRWRHSKWHTRWNLPAHIVLSHWGRVMYVCVGNLTGNSYILIQENAFVNVVREMAAILSRPPCVKRKSISVQFSVACLKTGQCLKKSHVSTGPRVNIFVL